MAEARIGDMGSDYAGDEGVDGVDVWGMGLALARVLGHWFLGQWREVVEGGAEDGDFGLDGGEDFLVNSDRWAVARWRCGWAVGEKWRCVGVWVCGVL